MQGAEQRTAETEEILPFAPRAGQAPERRREPGPYPGDGSAICALAAGAEAGPLLSGQGPGISFAPWKLPPYEEARATVSREVCDYQGYLLCCQHFPSACLVPGPQLGSGVIRGNQTVYWGGAKSTVTSGSREPRALLPGTQSL